MANPTKVNVPIKGSASFEFASQDSGNIGIQIDFNLSLAATGNSVAVEMLFGSESMGKGTLTPQNPSANFSNEFLEMPMLTGTLTADFQNAQLNYSLSAMTMGTDVNETWTGSVVVWSAEYQVEVIQPTMSMSGPDATVNID